MLKFRQVASSALLLLTIVSCSKKEAVNPSNPSTGTVTIGTIDLKTSFANYSQANKGVSTNMVNKLLVGSTLSNWYHVIDGVASIQFKSQADGSVTSDSVVMRNAAFYSKTLKTGIYDITFTSKSTNVADTFIRFAALYSNYNLYANGPINFAATTNDGVITISPDFILRGTHPTFQTGGRVYNLATNYADGQYWYIYVKNGTTGTISLTEKTTGRVLTQNVTVTQNTQFNVVVQSTANVNVNGLSLSFAAFTLSTVTVPLTPQTGFGTVSTFAGADGHGGEYDAPNAEAWFNGIGGIAADGKGNVYVTERGKYNKIRKISNGAVTTFAGYAAGYADGKGTAALFNNPNSMATDGAGNIYVADAGNYRIRKVTPDGTVTTVAGNGVSEVTNGAALSASFKNITGICVDQSGTTIYVVDSWRIRMIKNGQVTTVIGDGIIGNNDGSGTSARLSSPQAITLDALGNLYIADATSIRKADTKFNLTTVAGNYAYNTVYVDGTASNATFGLLTAIVVDNTGTVYVSDLGAKTIRKLSGGNVTTIAGNGSYGSVDGPALSASFSVMQWLTINPADYKTMYLVENSLKVRAITVK